jgi:hypothetical protein
VLDRAGHTVLDGALGVVLGVAVVEHADGVEQRLQRDGQAVVCGVQVGPERVAAERGDLVVDQRLLPERRGAP